MGFMPQMGAGGAFGFMSGGNTPQDWGQGIQNQPFQPYSTGGGTQPGGDPYAGTRMQMGPFGQIYNELGQNYTPYDWGGNPLTQAPLSMDFMSPGVGEQWQQQNQQRFLQPSQSGQYFGQAMGQYGQGGPGNAQAWFDQFKKPDIAADPGLDPYYQRAAGRMTTDINNQLAARGQFGSSAGMQQLSEGLGGLNAEQANREAQYNLQRLGEQRAWEGLGGQLAGQADQGALSWLMGMGNLAGQADSSDLSRLLAGMNSAYGAQGLARQRGQDFYNNLLGASLPMAGMAGDTYSDMLGTDASLMNNSLMMESGLAQAALNQSMYNQARQKADAEWAKGMMGGGKLGGKG